MDERFRDVRIAGDDWIGKKYRVEIGVAKVFTHDEGTEFDGIVNAHWYDLYVTNSEPMDISPEDYLVVWGTMTGYNADGFQVIEVDYWRPASDAELSP